ncbi:MAG: reverse transcriptase/maturase family protein [Clostridia bacterium]|nr:reverse transcriptase/maturase family protein [Clostridia bacterium]
MPKKVKKCFDKNLTFDKLLKAHNRAKKHKTYKNEVIQFEINLENNITNLLNSIKNSTYHLGKYRTFTIYEPKERIIKALPYIDRVVHQWYVEEFIKPFIVPRFIDTSYACLKYRGTHKAANEVQRQLKVYKRNYQDLWILKCDIKKFFYNIDPIILFNTMKKYISDNKLLEFTKLLIFDGKEDVKSIGIPIGNYTSQFFANIYLNELDQYIKRTLKLKYYTRYMDDFVILLKTKSDCILVKDLIEKFISNKLHLKLNEKSKYYPYKMGVDFCGYRIFSTHTLLRLKSKKKIKKEVKHWNRLYNKKILNINKTMQSLNSWLGHSNHCNSFKLQNKILSNCDFLYNVKAFNKIEKELIELTEK